MRVKLLQGFTDEHGARFRAGQLGTAGRWVMDGCRVVDFDCNANARERDAQQRMLQGESLDVVPGAAVVPVVILQSIQ